MNIEYTYFCVYTGEMRRARMTIKALAHLNSLTANGLFCIRRKRAS